MIDPITFFFVCWVTGAGLPDGRLNVNEVIKTKETIIIVDTISKDVELRPGL